jgi:(2Fe-2S) ferredoxin
MDAFIYIVSASYVSEGKFRSLANALVAAAPCRAVAVRLETSGDGFWHALDQLAKDGATQIELRPIGLPFSQSLEKWIPKAAGSWLETYEGPPPDVFFADPLQSDGALIKHAACATVRRKKITPLPKGEIGKGWDEPPAFKHHLLVCTGPRCHLKDAPNLLAALKAELGYARLTSDCLVTATGCLFPCNNGPVLVHYPLGNWYRITDLTDLRTFVAQALRAGTIPQNLLIHQTGKIHETA